MGGQTKKIRNRITKNWNRKQQKKYIGLIKKPKGKIALLEKSLSSKGGRRKRKTMKKM
jgi:hypothetical protein